MRLNAGSRLAPYPGKSLAHLVFGKTVAVEWHKQDRYQRVLGKVLLDGQDVNLKQIKAGLAWHYKQYDKDQRLADKRLYAEAQKAASLNGIGLWSDPAPVPPWDFEKVEFFPEGERDFFSKAVDAQITFEAPDEGRAESLVLHFYGQRMLGPRIGE